MATMTEIASAMLECFENELYDRMFEYEGDYIRTCILDSVSPVIRIDYRNGMTLSVNRDDYGYNSIIRMTHDYGNEADVYIDGKNIFDYK